MQLIARNYMLWHVKITTYNIKCSEHQLLLVASFRLENDLAMSRIFQRTGLALKLKTFFISTDLLALDIFHC